jgi:hypothetical protein
MHTRSTFTHEERFLQTLNTIKSVKEHIPNVTIILIEGSELTDNETQRIYKTGCDFIYDEHISLSEVINSDNKSLGETCMLLDFLHSDLFQKNKNKYNTFSKISGRYHLTDNFDFNKHDMNKVVCQCRSDNFCNTRYYRIPMKDIDIYINSLEKFKVDPRLLNYTIDIENYNIFKDFSLNKTDITYLPDRLGISGTTAPWNGLVEDFIN